MIKKLSVKITVLIVLILTVVMGSISAIYIFNSKDLYINNEIKSLNEFCEKIDDIADFSQSSKIENLLSEYEPHNYTIDVFDSSYRNVFSTRNVSPEKFEETVFLKGYSYTDGAERTRVKNGNERITVKRIMVKNGQTYYVHIYESLKTVDAVFSHTNKFLLMEIVLFMTVSAVSIFLLIHRAIKPIGELDRAAQEMAAGDYSARYSGVIEKNEIGTLSKSFNKMADTIQEDVNKITNYNFLLKEDMERLREYDKMRKRVLSNITHELKTPLAIISSQIEMMVCVDDSEKKNYYCESALSEIKTMSLLISRLLNFSSGEKDIFEAKAERTNLSERLKSNIKKISPIMLSKNIMFQSDIDEECYCTIVANHIERIFNNYIINAIHHVSGGGRIIISLKKDNDTIRLSVYNDGKNIKEDELDKIWSDFYKRENTADEMTAGLGLFIVKEISIIDRDECGVINRSGGVEFWYLFRDEPETEAHDE